MKNIQTRLFAPEILVDEEYVIELVRHLSRHGTLRDVEDLLREREAPFSGASWHNIATKRILPAISAGKLSTDELLRLLRETEEHQQQHIFLFCCKRDLARALLAPATVRKWLRSRNLAHLLDRPVLLDTPESAAFVDARFEAFNQPNDAFVLKLVTRRTREREIKAKTVHKDDRIIRHYDVVPERAVTVLRLHANAILEVRIQAHDVNSRARYVAELATIWSMVSDYFDPEAFGEYPLDQARENLRRNCLKLAPHVSVIGTGTVDPSGGFDLVIRAARPTASLQDRPSLVNTVEEFSRAEGAYSKEISLKWNKREDGRPPQRDVRILISGQPHEFVLMNACTKADFDVIARDIFNRSR
ncbi:hypothetical protein [Nannocystis pusilla]|uniref:hypothetical protein n=1 Tax=Nannocystis pusilla TaxID=889268 RepID=UPI003DA6BCB1